LVPFWSPRKKMASIQKRNGSYRVRIKRIGQSTLSKTFNSRIEAQQWANEIQAKITLGITDTFSTKKTIKTFEEASLCYRDTHSIHKKNYVSEAGLIRILNNRWHGLLITDIDKSKVLSLRDDLIKAGRSGSTINHYFNTISVIFQMLTDEWDVKVPNPIKGIKRMPPSAGRSKRVKDEVEERLLASCDKLSYTLLRAIIEFAIQTGMRRGELMGLTWNDIDISGRRAYLHNTKNGEARQVPLTQRSLNVLQSLERGNGGKVFQMSLEVLRNQFERIRADSKASWKDSGINPFIDLHFHDLRHEALSRLSDLGLNVIELSYISGHKTMAMLKRYTHPSHQAICSKLDLPNNKTTR